MKLKITEARSQKPEARGQKSEVGTLFSGLHLPAAASSRAQRAMALVITLIMLSVTLIMAIAFLAIAKRERVSVSTSTDSTVARFASDTALAAAQAQILANIQSSNAALFNYSLLVSTNYINPNGYDNVTANFLASPNNVSYIYPNGNPVGGADFAQVVANLMFLPRAPVMVSPNEPAGRFYLDLNRNGAFEDTGDGVANAVLTAGSYVTGSQVQGAITTNSTLTEIGDPQWVGVLEKPGAPHAADNQFVSRYAFIALPVGESLDLNYLHNQAVNLSLNNAQDGFFRNQSIGSWEINLAAFFADLNTNQWFKNTSPYIYNRALSGFANSGDAFYDAYSMLAWRYNYNYYKLAVAGSIFNLPPPPNIFGQDNIDIYNDGPLQFTTTNISEFSSAAADFDKHTDSTPWPGSDNPNKFYTPSDFFDPAKSSGGANSFTNRLLSAGNTVAANGAQPAYDRYTFYRMLDQLGTDSLPGNAGKLNLNYQNAVVNYDPTTGAFLNAAIVPGMETNLYAWNPRDFFCAAADMLLKVYTTNWFQANPSNYLATYYGLPPNVASYYYHDRFGNIVTNDPTGFGLTNWPFNGITNRVPAFGLANLPVQVNGNFVYTPAVNRLLQLAANIFDAGTNSSVVGGVDYPHVFRPIFYRNPVTTDIFIVGYTNLYSSSGDNTVLNNSDPQLYTPIDLTAVANNYSLVNVYGLPWIIGAKKYMPNFNEFYSFNTLQVSRKLQFNRKSAPSAWSGASKNLYTTNQMLVMSITNSIGFSFWNSYVSNYPGTVNVQVYANDQIKMRLSYNGWSYDPLPQSFPQFSQAMPVWPGSGLNIGSLKSPSQRSANASSFVTSGYVYPFVHEAAINLDQNGDVVGSGFATEVMNTNVTSLPPFPNFELDTTNRFQAFILDNGHVLDYVEFFGPSSVRNLGDDLKDPNSVTGNANSPMWSTNLSGAGSPPSGVNWGVADQINVSETAQNIPVGGKWTDPPNMPSGLFGIKGAEAAMFSGFFKPTWAYTNAGVAKVYINTNLSQQAPYTPTRTVVSPTLWVANDPLVHSLSSDLTQTLSQLNHVTNGVAKSDDPTTPPIPAPVLNSIQDYYQPWGRNAAMNEIVGVMHDDTENASYNLSYRDPLVYSSDNWDFPVNKYPSVGWLGRVHRGTPWQTVYLKATNLLDFVDNTQGNPNVGQTTWRYWTGNFNTYDSFNSKPIQDELLFDVFTAAPNDNAARGTLSVNQKHLAAWSAVLGGLLTISNITPNPFYNTTTIQTNVVLNPAGVDQLNSPLYQIVNGPNGINATRTNLYGDGGFPHVGDILRTPSLSQASPFLNALDNTSQQQFDVSDEMYEWLPQQLMSLVRPTGNPRFVVYSYGQTLKPAPDGTVLSSSALPSGFNPFGLVTNYQVVAESATRSVITVLPVLTNATVTVNAPTPYQTTVPVTNYTTKVESFNVLPPQ